MKKLYILILVALTTLSSTAQIINFPDANLKAKLLQPYVAWDITESDGYIFIDSNNDGEIEVSEAQVVLGLDISNSNISDLTGLSYFTALEYLDCSNNQLISINLGNEVSLSTLIASHNQLTSVNVNYSTQMGYLNLSYNNLTSFSLANVIIEENLNLSYNNLSSFVGSNIHVYEYFSLSNNLLINLQINNCSSKYFFVNNNYLSSSQNIGTMSVSNTANFSYNQFTFLNLSNMNFYHECDVYLGNNIVDDVFFGNSAPGSIIYSSNNSSFNLFDYRKSVNCEPYTINDGRVRISGCPNLQEINFKNGYNHTEISCDLGGETTIYPAMRLEIINCPNLSFICVDEIERPYIQASINQLGLGNQVQVNSYCSFVPGGTYYTIQGNTKFDSNNNGCDVNDINFGEMMFSITDGTNTGSVIANETGTYILPVQQGTHVVTPVLENPSYFTISPTSATVTFPAATSPFTQDFCVTANGVHNDVEISMMPIGVARPGFDATYKIVYKNKGNQVSNGTVGLSFDDAKMDLVSASPVNTGSATNSLSWDYSNLNPFETREITVVFNINSLMETPAVNDGDVLNYTATIVGATDEMPSDNTFTLNQTVVNSFDPNDKTCLEGTTITPSMVGNYVHYVIRFENTGTFAAQNVVVSDVIDTTKFNIGSLVTQSSSHPFVTRINSGKVEFIFENINLPFDDANNDGYVAFKIKTKPTLVLGDTFSNSANIYFDYNFPITTNTVMTTVSALAAQDFDFGSYFSVYPNPAKDVLHLATKNEIGVKSVSIYNTLGQMVLVVTNPENNATIDVANLKAGTYFIKVTTDKGTANTKFIKE